MSSLLRKIQKGKFNPALRTEGGKRRPARWGDNYRTVRRESKYIPHNGSNVVYSTNAYGNIVRDFIHWEKKK